MMIPYKRHDLVWLSEEGRVYALSNIQNCIPVIDDKEREELIVGVSPTGVPPIPAIVRRQEKTEDELLCIGFSFPRIIDGVRLRIGCKVPPDCIVNHITPFEVVKYKTGNMPALAVIEALMDAGDSRHIQVGCFGSAALQLVTGLPYWHKDSDLDIYLRRGGDRQELEQFFELLLKFEKQFSVTIDAEIEYQGQYGVKLKEMFGSGNWVLGKGLYDVALLKKGAVNII